MAELITGLPWPDAPAVLDLDALAAGAAPSLAWLQGLETEAGVVVGVVRGPCTGGVLAAALASTLLVAGPEAFFGRPGPYADIVARRAVGIAGRRVAGYLAASGRIVDVVTAHRWGVVSRVDQDPLAAARELADRLAAGARPAVDAILARGRRGATGDYLESSVIHPVVGAGERPPHVSDA